MENENNRSISQGRQFEYQNDLYTNYNKKRTISDFISQSNKEIKPTLEISLERKSNISTHTQITKQTPIKKSVNNAKIKESKAKKAVKIISKLVLITSILTTITYGGVKLYQKIDIHHQTEIIKTEIAKTFKVQLENMNIRYIPLLKGTPDEYINNLEKNIEFLDKNFIQENIFGFYLLTDNDYEIMNKLSKKAFGIGFGQYVKDTGYINEQRDSQDKVTGRSPDFHGWENAQEATALAKQAMQNKNIESKGK